MIFLVLTISFIAFQSKDPTKRGDLLISFDIVFPDKITPMTRETLKNSLPNK